MCCDKKASVGFWGQEDDVWVDVSKHKEQKWTYKVVWFNELFCLREFWCKDITQNSSLP